jgi:hypothetical protein
MNTVDPLGDFGSRFGAWWYSVWHGGDIHKNKYGEWYVLKTLISVSEGEATAELKVAYGKGRNQYSAALEGRGRKTNCPKVHQIGNMGS